MYWINLKNLKKKPRKNWKNQKKRNLEKNG